MENLGLKFLKADRQRKSKGLRAFAQSLSTDGLAFIPLHLNDWVWCREWRLLATGQLLNLR